jgi:hypothetical protein
MAQPQAGTERERLQRSQGEGLGTSLSIASAPPNAATNPALYVGPGLANRAKSLTRVEKPGLIAPHLPVLDIPLTKSIWSKFHRSKAGKPHNRDRHIFQPPCDIKLKAELLLRRS